MESSVSHRPVLGTSPQDRNRNPTPTRTILDYFPAGRGNGNHRKSYDGGGGLNHNIYLDAIVNDWSGEPEELFKRKNWKKWIRKEAHRRNNHDRFLNRKSLSTFVATLMDLLTDENKPHMDQVLKKFNEQQKAKFQKLKLRYDDQDSVSLLQQINGEAHSTTRTSWDRHSGDDDSSNDDDDEDGNITKTGVGWRSPEIRMEVDDVKRTPSPECYAKSDEEQYGGLYQEVYNDLGHKTKTSNEKSKIPKRNVQDAQEVIDRKRPRTTQGEGYKKLTLPPLQIKRTPNPNFSRKIEPGQFYNASNKVAASFNRSQSTSKSNGSRLDENGIKDALNESPKNHVKERARLHESATTPPYSPRCFSSNRAEPKRNEEPRKQFPSFRGNVSTPPFRKKIDSVLDKYSGYQRASSRGAEKENAPRREAPRIFGRTARTQVRNEPFTQSTSNKAAVEEIWEDDLPGNELVVDEAEKENFPVNAEEIILKYPKPPSAPGLTLEMFEEIKNTLERPSKDKIVSGFSFNILQEDLAIISNKREWLIDLNIDFYLELIKERSKQEGYPTVYIFHSFFYALLTRGDGGYNAVRDTTEKDDIFQFDLLLIPVILHQHWRLVVVKVQEKSIECYDSMDHSNKGVMNNIEEFLLRWEHLHTQQKENEESSSQDSTSTEVIVVGESEEPDDIGDGDKTITDCNTSKSQGEFNLEDTVANSPWTKHNKPSDTIPQQTNAIDCGIFVLQYAEYLSRQRDFDFNQSHIPYFRKRMTYETLTKKLLT